MDVRIGFDDAEPPTGWVISMQRRIHFTGWLGLLQALADALHERGEPSAQRTSDEDR